MICAAQASGVSRSACTMRSPQARRGIVFGAVQFLGKLQPKNVEPVARRAQREPQRSRRLALAVACIDLNLADLQ